jgi:tetratricopeptide (TPR) repeat protein
MQVVAFVARILLAASIAAAGLRYLCQEPYECNRGVKAYEVATTAATSKGLAGRRIARRNVVGLEQLETRCRSDVNVAMLLAANASLDERYHVAELAYERALRIDHRPEIYLNLGLVQVEMQKNDEALANFITAVRFDPTILDEVPEPLRTEVRKRLPGGA